MYKAPVKSLPPTNQNPIIPSRSYSNEIFTGRLPFSTPKQQHQNTEGKYRLLWRTMARYQPWFTAHCVRLKITHKTLHINFCIMTGNIRYQRSAHIWRRCCLFLLRSCDPISANRAALFLVIIINNLYWNIAATRLD